MSSKIANHLAALVASALGLAMSAAACDCGDGGTFAKAHAKLGLDPTGLDFGEVPIGATKSLTVHASNSGDDTLYVCLSGNTLADCPGETHVDPMGAPFAADFPNADPTLVWILEPRARQDFTVSFSPQVAGPSSGSLFVSNNTLARTATVTLTGVGIAPQLDFSADDLDFGEVTVGMRKTLDLVLTNGTAFPQPVTIDPLTQSSVTFGTAADGGADTPEGQPFQGAVPANGSLTVKVWFQPPEEGPKSNTLHVTYCPTCTKDVGLTGTGVKPAFALDPAALDFGSVTQGQSGTRSFVVRNVGNSNLTVNTIDLEPGTPPKYQITPSAPLPAVLAPGQELPVEVAYAATSPGQDGGRVRVDTNAWDDPATPASESVGFVALSATCSGPDISVLPNPISFGTVAVGGHASRSVIIQNAGNTQLVVTNLTLTTPTSEIRLANLPGLPANLDPGATAQFEVDYSPTDAGADDGTVNITSNDPDSGNLAVPVSGTGGVPMDCAITVAPSQLSFGVVERGRRATLPVEIRNSGAETCNVSGIAVVGASEFSLPPMTSTSLTIPAGSAVRTNIVYAPTAYGMHNALFVFDSNDPNQGQVQVPITGASAPSDLEVIPSQLDFNVVPVSCRSALRTVTLYNTGSNTITVTQVYLDPTTSSEFELSPYPVPTTIRPGQQSTINLHYHPADIGSDTGVLFIVHSASAIPVAVPLTGQGAVSGQVTDTFSQLPTPQADVLFVVDNSQSMGWAQDQLGSNLGAFLSFAQQQSIDYHIAVTTTDVEPPGSENEPPWGPAYTTGGERGAFVGNPKVITPQDRNANADFQSRVVGLGTEGSSLERGLEAAYLALSDPLINAGNAGFLRTDAALAVIVVSDDDESRDDVADGQGANAPLDPSARPVNFYIDFFRNIKGFQNTSMFSFSAVVEPTPGACRANDRAEAQGFRYIQVAQATGGVVESICDTNWGQTLSNISLNTFGLRRSFTLSSQPVPSTIAVTVDGTQVTQVTAGGQRNWSYDATNNAVLFEPSAVPPANSTIAVTYTVACLP